MNNKSGQTIRTHVGGKKKDCASTVDRSAMKQTMQISLNDILQDVPVDTVAHLDVVLPDEARMSIRLGDTPVEIGREESCDVCLPLHNVSRVHARIIWDHEEHLIEDMGSTNGTFLNNVRVACCTLRNNDHIRIGEARLTYIRERIQRKA